MLSNQQNPKFHRFPHTFPLKYTNIQCSYGYFHRIVLHLPIVRMNAFEINGVPIYTHLTSTDTYMNVKSSCCLRCRCPHKTTECVDCLLPILFWLICIYSIFLPCQCERCQTVLLPNRSVY
ncbi:hypothetical protein BLOT_013760 [Blomia tropicalis]|nr:hypothetical protein BLOT_013760 [Blomia tropicalis]